MFLQENFEEAIEDSTKALELNPNYLKALLRRAELYEKTEKLDEALADYTQVVNMDPSQHAARIACAVRPEHSTVQKCGFSSFWYYIQKIHINPCLYMNCWM